MGLETAWEEKYGSHALRVCILCYIYKLKSYVNSDIAERARRKWLCRSFRTLTSCGVGVMQGLLALNLGKKGLVKVSWNLMAKSMTIFINYSFALKKKIQIPQVSPCIYLRWYKLQYYIYAIHWICQFKLNRCLLTWISFLLYDFTIENLNS